MNWIDWLVLLGTMLGIAAYGIWRTRGKRDLDHYLKGDRDYGWIVIGISVMATQASAVTFLSMPGQGYESGIGFIQNYFGAPFAMILIAAVFVPIYQRLKIFTAYEYLGKRFDTKTRLLGAGLFLLQRGVAAGITIYAPAIVLSTMLGWRLDLTILLSGLVVIVYTVTGGSEAVTLTQKYQFLVIVLGMVSAFVVLMMRLPGAMSFGDAMALAGGLDKLKAVDYSTDYRVRYTFWSGLLGGMFLALSYFGTDQTQVQRYIGGPSMRESRLGLIFNAIFKIPMQVFILMLGAMLFVFYQAEKPPLFFNQVQMTKIMEGNATANNRLSALKQEYDDAFAEKSEMIRAWMLARNMGDSTSEARALSILKTMNGNIRDLRDQAKTAMRQADPRAKASDADYVFITFILNHLPHGLIGLLIAVFFAATLASKAGELNALASTTIVDVYRHLVRPDEPDRHYVIASKVFTVAWGVVAVVFAMFFGMVENLIQAGNIVASLFYGVILGLFLIGFFLRWIGGTAVFISAITSQVLVLVLYYTTNIGYLWYNVIGPAACVVLSILIQLTLGPDVQPRGFEVIINPASEDLPAK